jgi:branched-chain amino acid transport system ATP-binding protein
MDLVSSVCDRLVVLDFGRIIASGEPPVVRNDPAVLEAYLGRSTEDDEPED